MKFGKMALMLAAAGFFFCAGGAAEAAELPKDANTTCPVMMKEEVDAELFVDYKGERVYLCCKKCKTRFNKDPEKYMERIRAAKKSAKPVAAAGTEKPAKAAQ